MFISSWCLRSTRFADLHHCAPLQTREVSKSSPHVFACLQILQTGSTICTCLANVANVNRCWILNCLLNCIDVMSAFILIQKSEVWLSSSLSLSFFSAFRISSRPRCAEVHAKKIHRRSDFLRRGVLMALHARFLLIFLKISFQDLAKR